MKCQTTTLAIAFSTCLSKHRRAIINHNRNTSLSRTTHILTENMSTRWYPLYNRGGPQLRVFLPNFWLKLVRPTHEQPPNIVQFACSMEMTQHDVKNYLEKVYNVPVVEVRTRIGMGATRRDMKLGYVTKAEDTKYAYVTLPKDQTFEFPDLFPSDVKQQQEDDSNSLDQAKEVFKKYQERNRHRPGTPGWFSL